MNSKTNVRVEVREELTLPWYRYMTPLLSTYSLPPEDDESRYAYMLDGERTVVEWRNVDNSEKQKISFQIIVIHATGDIQFVYRDES